MAESKKKIVITGSSGFVGTNFIAQSPEYSILEVDLLNQDIADIDLSGYDSLLHLAALVHQMQGAPDEAYYTINRDLAFNVAQQAKKQGVKQFIFMSTAKVYGESTTNSGPFNENSACNPMDTYGKSKFEAENLIQSLADENFQVAIIRSPLVYGKGVKANMLNLIGWVNRVPIIPLGGIHNRRSMVYIGNLVALIKCVLDRKASGIFIATDSETLSTTQVVRAIATGLQRKIFLFSLPAPARYFFRKIKPGYYDRLFGSFELNNSITCETLGFMPPYPYIEGFRDMVTNC